MYEFVETFVGLLEIFFGIGVDRVRDIFVVALTCSVTPGRMT